MSKQTTFGDLRVAHVTDFYRKYPGELVTIYTQVEIPRGLPNLAVRVLLPPELIPEEARIIQAPNAGAEESDALLEVSSDTEERYYLWQIDREIPAETRCEYQTRARIAPTAQNITITSRAIATCEQVNRRAEEALSIAVSAKGKYLDYLPGIYQDDELMARFLMLFESFWAPIEQQIDSIWYYFDPRMTTTEFLPWLASWLGLTLDEQWSEEKKRRLLSSAISLYRMRGTKEGLRKYLEIYTDGQIYITEHRAKNFMLGREGRLGPGIALGKGNKPHSFKIMMKLPSLKTARQETHRRLMIEKIIDAEKPAHTDYTLEIEKIEAAK